MNDPSDAEPTGAADPNRPLRPLNAPPQKSRLPIDVRLPLSVRAKCQLNGVNMEIVCSTCLAFGARYFLAQGISHAPTHRNTSTDA